MKTPLACALLLAAPALHAGPNPKETETFVEATIPFAPRPAPGSDGRTYLLYEIHLTYLPVFPTTEAIELRKIEVLDGETGGVIRAFSGKQLDTLVRRPGREGDPKKIAPDMRAIFFSFLPFEKEKLPSSLRHRLTFRMPGDPPKKVRTLEGPGAIVAEEDAIVIGPPMRGGGWVAVNGPGPSSGHRMAAIPFHGRTHVAQRFAVDWILVDENGNSRRPGSDPKQNESYYCYGRELLAVEDGTIVDLRDGRPDNFPVGTRAPEAGLVEGLAGNFVTLDLGDNRYAVYCHLQPGSLRVKKGDRVRRGQTLGLVGNAGNSSEPHLHFHIGTAAEIFDGEGLPFAIDSYEIQLSAAEGAALDRARDAGKPFSLDLRKPGKPVKNAMPLENEIGRFGQE